MTVGRGPEKRVYKVVRDLELVRDALGAFADDMEAAGRADVAEALTRGANAVGASLIALDHARELLVAPPPADNKLGLLGVAEVAALARVTKSAVVAWRDREPDFPAPVAVLAAGPVWTRAEVEAWLTARGLRTAYRHPQHVAPVVMEAEEPTSRPEQFVPMPRAELAHLPTWAAPRPGDDLTRAEEPAVPPAPQPAEPAQPVPLPPGHCPRCRRPYNSASHQITCGFEH